MAAAGPEAAHTRLGWGLQVLGLAAAYAVTGKLGLLLAIPPGYATAIWPPSGIALAGVLLFGYRVWPGVLLGSFLVNVWTGFDASTTSGILESLAVPIGIGSGAALQAVIGAFLVRRFAGYPNPLANERDVFSFLFWGGPVGCLVNSVIGVWVLLAAGKIPVSNFLINSGTWWIGDTIGVFIFTPLVLVWTLRPSDVWKPRRATVTLPMAITFTLAVLVVAFGANWERDRLILRFEKQATVLAGALEKSLIGHIAVLHSLKSFHAASVHIDRTEFRTFVGQPLKDRAGLQALSWNPRIFETERAEFESSTQREGFSGFQITERNAEGQLVRAAKRPEYVVVHYIEPFKGNEKAFGFDVGSNPTRRKALDLARDTGQPVATARITLVQETGKQFGILVFSPIYRNGLPRESVEDRRRNLAGYMVGAFRGGDIVTGALHGLDQEGLVYRLFDESAPAGEQFLFENRPGEQGVTTLDEEGLFGGSTPIGRSFPINVGGRHWRFEVSPTQGYLALHRPENTWLILIAGMLLTSLVGAFVMVVSGRSCMLRELVDERTAALRQLSAAVEQSPASVVITDTGGVIQYVNPKFTEVTGYTKEEAIGQNPRLLKSGETSPKDYATLWQTITGGEVWRGEFHNRRKDGALFWEAASISPIRSPDGEITHYLAVKEDITERKTADMALSEKSMELERSNADLQQFAYVASHDLREPLRMVTSYLQLLDKRYQDGLDDAAHEYIDFAVDGAKRMDALIKDLLLYSRVDTHGDEFKVVSSLDALQEALENLKALVEETTALVTIDDDMPLVMADESQLLRLFQNLFNNAIKYRSSDRSPEIHVGVDVSDGFATFSVRDNGIGIDPEFFDRIFVIFQRLHGREEFEGTGIGLAVCKKIIERHGGRIWLESAPGSGSTFFFTLPIPD